MIPEIALLAVSLFKREYEGGAFRQHLSLLDRDPRFDRVMICLGDSLYAHNLPIDCGDIEKRRIRARSYGENWMRDQSDSLMGIDKPCQLVRHDLQISLPLYPSIRSFLDIVFTQDPFNSALQLDIEAFGKRRQGIFDPAACRAYILEELAADISVAQIAPFTHVYPGKILNAYRAVCTNSEILPPLVRGLEHCAFQRTRLKEGRIRYSGPVWATCTGAAGL